MFNLFIVESRDSVLLTKFHVEWNQYKYILKRWRTVRYFAVKGNRRELLRLNECFSWIQTEKWRRRPQWVMRQVCCFVLMLWSKNKKYKSITAPDIHLQHDAGDQPDSPSWQHEEEEEKRTVCVLLRLIIATVSLKQHLMFIHVKQ